MHVEVNTNNYVHGDERLREVVEQHIRKALGPLEKRITDVEVHVKDMNANKGGVDIRVTVEARPEGLRPMSAHYDDTNIDAAVRGAARKMRHRLDSEFGKLSDRR